MNDFLKKLYDTKIPLSLLLMEAKEIAEINGENELVCYIDNEITGYKVEDKLPAYRILKGEIVCDIYNIYGITVAKEHYVDFDALSDKIGFDLNAVHFVDDISFIEATLKNITGTTAIRPIHKEIVTMLGDVFHRSNPQHHLQAAYHKFPKSTIEYIPTRVRLDVIQAFQNVIFFFVLATSRIMGI